MILFFCQINQVLLHCNFVYCFVYSVFFHLLNYARYANDDFRKRLSGLNYIRKCKKLEITKFVGIFQVLTWYIITLAYLLE